MHFHREEIVKKLILTLATLSGLLFVGPPILAQGGPRSGNGAPASGPCSVCAATPAATQPLTMDEIRWLLFLREEEKLARDVYLNLYDRWKLIIFSNIAQSEQRHFDAMGVLLTRYGVADPASNQTGVFTNPDLQKLYDDLVREGQATAVAALQAGVTIEEHDIQDLMQAIAATKKPDIERVYRNLLSGSLSHLEAFESHLEVLGVNP